MGKEIERKYLVINEEWEKFEKPNYSLIHQGYIMDQGGTTIRVRHTNEKGFLTIKGNQVRISRDEFEYEIPQEEAKYLYENFCSKKLVKRRYLITYFEKIWEVDEYLENLAGLVIAEIELSSEDEIVLESPGWVGDEVSNDIRYSNASLAN